MRLVKHVAWALLGAAVFACGGPPQPRTDLPPPEFAPPPAPSWALVREAQPLPTEPAPAPEEPAPQEPGAVESAAVEPAPLPSAAPSARAPHR